MFAKINPSTDNLKDSLRGVLKNMTDKTDFALNCVSYAGNYAAVNAVYYDCDNSQGIKEIEAYASRIVLNSIINNGRFIGRKFVDGYVVLSVRQCYTVKEAIQVSAQSGFDFIYDIDRGKRISIEP